MLYGLVRQRLTVTYENILLSVLAITAKAQYAVAAYHQPGETEILIDTKYLTLIVLVNHKPLKKLPGGYR